MDLSLIQCLVIAAVGALGSILVNRGVAVFNDGLRPIMPEYLEGRMTRGEPCCNKLCIKFWINHRVWYSAFHRSNNHYWTQYFIGL